MRDDPGRRLPARYPWGTDIPTRFADMDSNRHINNVAVAQLFEEARVRFNWALRDAHPDLERPRYLVGHIGIDYLAEGLYPLPVHVRLGIAAVGTSSLRNAMAMFQDGRCVALAETVMVHRGNGGSAPIPDALRTALEAYRLVG